MWLEILWVASKWRVSILIDHNNGNHSVSIEHYCGNLPPVLGYEMCIECLNK